MCFQQLLFSRKWQSNPSSSLSSQRVRKLRVDTRKAVSFCVNLSRLALSKLLLTSANNLLNASFNFAWLFASCVLIKWSLYAVKLDSLESMRLNIGRITAQWFCGAPNRSKLKRVAVKLENRLGCAAKCCSRREYSCDCVRVRMLEDYTFNSRFKHNTN